MTVLATPSYTRDCSIPGKSRLPLYTYSMCSSVPYRVVRWKLTRVMSGKSTMRMIERTWIGHRRNCKRPMRHSQETVNSSERILTSSHHGMNWICRFLFLLVILCESDFRSKVLFAQKFGLALSAMAGQRRTQNGLALTP